MINYQSVITFNGKIFVLPLYMYKGCKLAVLD